MNTPANITDDIYYLYQMGVVSITPEPVNRQSVAGNAVIQLIKFTPFAIQSVEDVTPRWAFWAITEAQCTRLSGNICCWVIDPLSMPEADKVYYYTLDSLGDNLKNNEFNPEYKLKYVKALVELLLRPNCLAHVKNSFSRCANMPKAAKQFLNLINV
jgi:hypothetical protein